MYLVVLFLYHFDVFKIYDFICFFLYAKIDLFTNVSKYGSLKQHLKTPLHIGYSIFFYPTWWSVLTLKMRPKQL